MKSLSEWVRVENEIWTFQVPEAHVKKQGLIQAVLLPVVLGFIWLVLSALGSADGWLVPALWGALLGPIALLGVVLGARKVMGAAQMSEDSRHVVDVAAKTVDGVAVQPSQIQIRQPSVFLKFLALEVATAEGPRPLLVHIAPAQGPATAELGEELAGALRIPFADLAGARTAGRFGINDKTAGMLCWMPFQGIWLFASLFYLWKAKDRPFVRSCAIQSLTLFGFTLLGYAFFGLIFGGLSAATDHPAAIGILILGISGVALANLGIRAVGCWKSLRGEPWVAPGLRGVTRRWLMG